jgi:hypothetical protein
MINQCTSLVSLVMLGTVSFSAYSADKTQADSDKQNGSATHVSVRDFGLREYAYLSKNLPHSEKDTWTLVGQFPEQH